MPIYNDIKKCQNCNKELTEKETERIKNEKTLRFCDLCWEEVLKVMPKLSELWNKAKL